MNSIGYQRQSPRVLFTALLVFAVGCGGIETVWQEAGNYRISVTVRPDPPAVGMNSFILKVTDEKKEAVSGSAVHIQYSMPAMAGMPAMGGEVTAEETKEGTYKAEVDLSAGGKFPWNIRMEVVNEDNGLTVSRWQVTPGTKGVKFVSSEGGEGMEGEIDQTGPGTGPAETPTVTVSSYQQQLIGVQFDTVKAIPAQKTIRTVGIVDYDETKIVTVNLKFSGWIEKLFVDYTGKQVKKGQPLFTIYSPELVSTQQEYLQTPRTALREKPVTGSKNDISPQEGFTGNPYTRFAEERLYLWGLSREQINKLAHRGSPETAVTFYSPADGYVIEKNIFEGSKAQAGMNLYTIADLSTLWVLADVYEFELPFVRVGHEANITLSYDPGARHSGKVDYVYPTLNKTARTAKVRIVVPNPGGKLMPDMFVNVGLNFDMGTQVTVAETSVLETGLRQLVFVNRGRGQFQPREVKLGPKVGSRVIVLEGLEPGEVVVKSGNFLIDAEAQLQGVLQRR